MAVFNRCSKCKTLNSTKRRQCSKCDKALGKDYYIRYTDQYKKNHTEKIGSSIGFAREVLAKRKTEVREGKFFGTKKNEMLWTDFMDTKFIPYSKQINRSFQTKRYIEARNYKEFDKPITQIQRADIDSYRQFLDNGERKPATINRYIATIKAAFNYAESLELIEKNPMRLFPMMKEKPVERRVLSFEDQEKLLTACKQTESPFLYYVVSVGIYTGMRYSEIMSLKWKHINFEVKSIRIYETKNNESREIPLSKHLDPILRELKQITGNQEYVFINTNTGKGLRFIQDSFRKAVKNAGIGEFVFHELRHTMISRLVMSGASYHEIQMISGHKTPKMVQRYTHTGLRESKRTIDRFDDFLEEE